MHKTLKIGIFQYFTNFKVNGADYIKQHPIPFNVSNFYETVKTAKDQIKV